MCERTLLGILLVWATINVLQGQPIAYDWKAEALKTTEDRIRMHGYPTEVRYVETEDNYVIQLFRIPFSHNLQNQNVRRPVVYLQHGITASSDSWVLNGPNDGLPYLLSDAGYDVWLGNARGSRYSRNNTRLSPNHPYFWRFSWHEIGVIDVATCIDYILEESGEPSIHYVGHSQGTTVFFVLMAERPEYNKKISTAHMLAPIAFMSNMSMLVAKYTSPFLGTPNKLTHVIDTMEITPSALYYADLYEEYCKPNPVLAFMCSNLYYAINNVGSIGNINTTIAEHLNETTPAGASSTQFLHYLQEYESGHFRQLDHGEGKNMQIYGRPTPPDYDVSQITANLHLYFADSDKLSSLRDVEHLITLLPKTPSTYHVPDPTFSHIDYIYSFQVKKIINDPIVNACNDYEKNIGKPLPQIRKIGSKVRSKV